MIQCKFYFDFGSPNSYLSHLVIPEIEYRNKISFDYIPILLGGIFKLTGNVSPVESLKGIKNKAEYLDRETNRFLEKYKITSYKLNPHFPLNTLNLMRGAIAAQKLNVFEDYSKAIFTGIWVKDLNLGDLEVLKDYLEN